MLRYRGVEYGGSHRRVARLGPARPPLVERIEADRREAELLGHPHLRGDGVFEPLLQVARVEGAHVPPFALRPPGAGPVVLAGPIARGDEHEGDLLPLGRRRGADAGRVIAIGLAARVSVGPELPPGRPAGDPRRRRVRLDRPVPTLALGVVTAGEIDPAEVAAGGMDELAQEHGQPAARLDTVRPVVDEPGLYGEAGAIRSFPHCEVLRGVAAAPK